MLLVTDNPLRVLAGALSADCPIAVFSWCDADTIICTILCKNRGIWRGLPEPYNPLLLDRDVFVISFLNLHDVQSSKQRSSRS